MKVDRAWINMVGMALTIVVLIGLAYGVKDTRAVSRANQRTVADLKVVVAGGRTTRIEFQARQTFLLCSRSSTAVLTPSKVTDVERLCRGYETMDRALVTEKAKQAKADTAAR